MKRYSKIELGISSVIFIFALFIAVNNGNNEYWLAKANGFTGESLRFTKIFPFVLAVIATYSGFLILNYWVIPKYWFQKKYFEAAGLTVSTLVLVALSFMVTFSYLRDWEYDQGSLSQANMDFFSRGAIIACAFLFVFGLYVTAREIIIYQYKLSRRKQSLASRITREIVLLFSIWVAVLLPFLIFHGTGFFRDIGGFYLFALPYCFIIYFLNLYWLVPEYKKDNNISGLKYFFKLTITALIAGVIEMAFLLQMRQFSFMGYLVILWLLPTMVTVAISWWVYWRNEEIYQQLTSLQTELGTSNANLQYLRAQINPHFLFNALNTLYGTALMEKAEKTGEGIQKLGDMMRFMLHENNQDKIALSHELAYLHNYIDLQNMRLALSPDIQIDIQIQDIEGYHEIAPMLLLTFVENAYKHGISLQERSWIDLQVYKRDEVLHLDIRNSIHTAGGQDPERFNSGIGLENVRQRLQLIYPGKHELTVRQNAKEFIVLLSIDLGGDRSTGI